MSNLAWTLVLLAVLFVTAATMQRQQRRAERDGQLLREAGTKLAAAEARAVMAERCAEDWRALFLEERAQLRLATMKVMYVPGKPGVITRIDDDGVEPITVSEADRRALEDQRKTERLALLLNDADVEPVPRLDEPED